MTTECIASKLEFQELEGWTFPIFQRPRGSRDS